jgi:pyruvate dehydrogenase E1 component alpha subunit
MNKRIKIQLFEMMLKIRLVEEEIVKRYSSSQMRCPTHLSIGQEAVPAALGLNVNDKDYAISTHRGHGHYIGKGGNIRSMIAEIYGKSTGCSKGRGGSMHLIDRKVGFMGTSAIVGNSIPVGVGFGLSSKIKKTNQISCVFFGDGATEEGVYYESLNFAVLKKLPILFICENNFYSVYSPLKVRQPPNRSVTDVAKALGLGTQNLVDGNDVLSSYNSINKAIKRIKKGNGPQFIEFSTYRWREHCGVNFDNDLGYRSEKEFNEWKRKDPISNFKDYLISENIISIELLQQIKSKIDLEIQDAFNYAIESPFPEANQAYIDEYAT